MTEFEIEYFHKSNIKDVIKLLNEIGDKRTVIVGPSYGSSNMKPMNKLRVYSWGGRALDLSTTRRANNDLLKDKGYKDYITEGSKITLGNVSYEYITKDVLKEMINITKKRATGEGGSDKDYEERSVETLLIYNNRKTLKHKNAVLIDMEFYVAKSWIEADVEAKGKTKTGKPDLIVYDKEECSFGLIELKYKNQSCDNMTKHIKDFHNIVHSKNSNYIKKELCRRMRYLSEYGIIDTISKDDLNKAVNNEMWYAFLFVNGNGDDSKLKFEEALKNAVIKDNVGYMYVRDEDQDINYSKKNFFNSRQ